MAARLLLLSLVVLGCADSTGLSATARAGMAHVTTNVRGVDAPDKFSLVVDEGAEHGFAPSTVVTKSLAAGPHSVRLIVSSNCTVDGENPRVVSVAARDTTPIIFSVACVAIAGVLELRAASTGLDIPMNYGFQVGATGTVTVWAHGAAFVPLPPGPITIKLIESADNCTVSDSVTRRLTVTAGTLTRDTVRAAFSMSCTATAGVVRVAITTVGEDPNLHGYMLGIDQSAPRSVPTNDTSFLSAPGAGDHTVRLTDIPSNCSLTGANTRTVRVTTGSLIRDTARTDYNIACERTERIGFTRYTQLSSSVWITQAEGTEPFNVGDGVFGSWSPDGQHAVIERCSTVFYYYWFYYPCPQSGLFMLNTARLPEISIKQLTTDPRDVNPAVSPDGRKIAFTRADRLMLVNADGTGKPILLVTEPSPLASDPAWSPDGTRIAFTCQYGNWRDICLADPDAAGVTRLTADSHDDREPSWSLDGATLAVATNRGAPDGKHHIALFSLAESTFVRLAPGRTPRWSRDGTKIVFAVNDGSPGLFVMNRDGTGVIRLTRGDDRGPAWRP